jgi:hypothetical protein
MPVFCRGLPSVHEAVKGKFPASFLEAKLFSELDAVFSALVCYRPAAKQVRTIRSARLLPTSQFSDGENDLSV